uniref:LRAT domain-containing protein n=1 Tax=Panagrellus redivivus TaxID=6233 RepID=A0A7E4VIY7_PANRE
MDGPVSPHSLQRGDHIKRCLSGFRIADHHGIYLGENKVAHFNSPPGVTGKKIIKSEGSVRIDFYRVFAEKQPVFRVEHGKLKKSKNEVAELAEKLAEEETGKGKYHLFFNNCAHFVYYCYGEEDEVPILNKHLFYFYNSGDAFAFGGIGVETTGVGIKGKAAAFVEEVAIGGVPCKGAVGTAELGAKLWDKNSGLDLGFKTNMRVASAVVGPVSLELGPSFDTGIQVGSDGIGAAYFGIGGQIGPKTNIQLFGIKIGIDFGSLLG